MEAQTQIPLFKDESDRVRAHSAPEVNVRLDREMETRILHYANADRNILNERLAALDREWDIERVLEVNASVIAAGGVATSFMRGRRWLALPAVVVTFLLQHAIQGWCPPLAVFRRLGIRTRREIAREKYAMKAIRGDFSDIKTGHTVNARQVIQAVGQ